MSNTMMMMMVEFFKICLILQFVVFHLDFVSKVDNPKKTRNGKPDDPQTESTRQLPRKRKEKFAFVSYH